MANLKKTFARKKVTLKDVKMKPYMLGNMIIKFEIPLQIIDEINEAYDEKVETLVSMNNELVGKIEEENEITNIITEDTKLLFIGCFQQYLKSITKPSWGIHLQKAWVNEMKSGEYNPLHFHSSAKSDLGLSSVLMLKRPDWYGVEASNEESPSNGWLEFTGGNQDPLGISQFRVDAQVGDFYVFPYTMLHGVYPFNSTDEKRRTMSYNCDLVKPPVKQMILKIIGFIAIIYVIVQYLPEIFEVADNCLG